MKKIFSVLVLVLLIAFPVLAADGNGVWTNGNESLNSTGKGQNALLQASFTIDEATIGDQVVVGFTSESLDSESFNASTPIASNLKNGVTLSDSNKSGTAKSTGIINAYAQVTSFNNVTVSLSIKDLMRAKGEGESEIGVLGWHVKSGSDVDLHIDETTYSDGTVSSKDLLIHTPSDTDVSSAEFMSLSIETDNYRDKAPGTYNGTVYITVKADSAGQGDGQ